MPPDLTEDEKARLAQIVQEKPTLTGAKFGHLVRPGKKKKPKEWVIWRALKNLGSSRKKASFEADEKSRPETKKHYRPFTKKAKKTDLACLIFLDKTGIDR